ncbi:MAG: polyphosphate kinase 1 [Polyangiaceae bacterium]|nr:polyphosphate kinase 1 [Polyangiaceae bacterium]
MTHASAHDSPGPPSVAPLSRVARLDDPRLYINRETSWLEFNARVLAEAATSTVPLYERLKFLAIFASNLDEFFMVRVAGLQAQRSGELDELPPDGATPEQQLRSIGKRAHELVVESYRIWGEGVLPGLREAGIVLLEPHELSVEEQRLLDERFERDIFPVLTPIAIDPVHPFPHLRNKSVNVAVAFDREPGASSPGFGIVQVPTTLARMLRVPREGTRRAFVALENVIIRHLEKIFPAMRVSGAFAFRVIRNFDIEIDEDEGEDLLLAMQAELRRRELGAAVMLGVTAQAPSRSVEFLCRALRLDAELDVFRVDGPLNLADMTHLVAGDERRDLRDEPYTPQYVPPLRDSDDFFATIRERDVLLHHPYESFEAVVDFLFQAADDPNVLAIKQTLYRTGGESPMVRALQRAAEAGKQVTALVELKARFDEESNIQWARALERSGVNVMYGLLGLKTHAKVLLVVRREPDGLRRYVHLATGNYNQQTARLYTDLSLFTARHEIGEDATALFNLLTGYSAPRRWNHLIVAPLGLHEAVLGLIARETAHAAAGRPAGIVAKMNSIVDADVIAALYEAAQAGVSIDLLVRGICCLRPGISGVSERIRVHAVIDRFLEHSRIYHFVNGGAPEVFCASADWMPRNFRRRVEVMFPILDERIRERVTEEILGTMRRDDAKGWVLRQDGTYARVAERGSLRSQQRFMELARQSARERDEAPFSMGSRQLAPIRTPLEAMEKLRPKERRKRKRARDDD